MAGEITVLQEGQAVGIRQLANVDPTTVIQIAVAQVGAGDQTIGVLDATYGFYVVAAIWGSHGPAGGQTVNVRDAAAGAGNVLAGPFNSADAAAPVVQCIKGIGVGTLIPAGTVLYANCSGAITGYILLILQKA